MSASVITTSVLSASNPRAFEARGVVRVLDWTVFVSLLLLMTLVTIPYGTVEPWWIALYEVSVFAAGVIAVVVNWDRRRPRLLPELERPLPHLLRALLTNIWIAPVLFLVFIFFQTSSDPLETRLTFFKLLALLTHLVLLYRYTSTRKRLRAVVYTLIAIAVTSSVFGIVRHELQHNEIGFGLPLLKRDTGFAQFVNKNHFALFIEMSLGLATGLVLSSGVRKHFLPFVIAAIVLMWTALILTSSRGALFSMFGQLAFVIATSIWLRRRGRLLLPSVVLGVCLLVAVGIGAIWMGGDLLTTRLEQLSGEIRSEAIEPHAGVRRREIWNATWQLFKQHPIVGSGAGAYAIAITRFHDASGKWTPEAAHNDYLELLATAGIVGAMLVLWFSVAVIVRSREQLKSHDRFRRAACLGALTGIVGVLLHNFVDFGLHVTANSVSLVALIVIATKTFQSVTREDIPYHT
jgi:O-antigen ligase